jgi:2-polyprenyl-3-methyl-5-hydroxy-6-metoxy-1,4-benzoquinol methylase
VRPPADRDSSVWRFLSSPLVYTQFQNRLAVRDARAIIVERYARVQRNDAVLDVGCGPADVLRYLPEVDYVGIDRSSKYVPEASRRHRARGNRVKFIQMNVDELGAEWTSHFDVALALGVLHHLSDEQALSLLTRLASFLKPGGRLVTTDPAFTDDQHWIARLLIRADRGRFVRRVEAYGALASSVFGRTGVHVHHDLLRLPYTHVIMECQAALLDHR